MTKTQAATMAQKIKAATREHGLVDVFLDTAGDLHVLPADAEHLGRYTEAVPPAWVVGDLMEMNQ